MLGVSTNTGSGSVGLRSISLRTTLLGLKDVCFQNRFKKFFEFSVPSLQRAVHFPDKRPCPHVFISCESYHVTQEQSNPKGNNAEMVFIKDINNTWTEVRIFLIMWGKYIRVSLYVLLRPSYSSA